ncbi:glycoside hydrolase family 2 protein [Paenibacillus sp. 23TSA30-6]|uniref:glycoside hydrolase family 2 protein n=1 Tax=Paenibacillus sp. 23TSA30-6 TaxID=2546104 RepID=UPI001788745C|nr:glycoside hydrolase family 2 protein [Paenibacillus sp. 23TSA30-6]MBE0337750.1 glycoside hydrolase family 2 protein [Paenibacillus sp. 23TSA30-6]
MRTILPMNDQWFYRPEYVESEISAGIDASRYEPILLPHTNVELPYNYFDDKAFQFVSTYKRELNIPADTKGKRVYVDFEGVMTYAQVYLNGVKAGEHKGGYTPFSIELTGLAEYGGSNVLTVIVDSTERDDIPPFGAVIDYLTYGGIYREVQLRVVEPVHLGTVFVQTPEPLAASKAVRVVAELEGVGDQEDDLTVALRLLDGANVKAEIRPTEVKSAEVTLELKELNGLQLWDIDDPKLYEAELTLLRNGEELDRLNVRFGFREAEFQPDGFYLNGRKLKLLGLNRHQSYPYVGYAMPKRAQRRDADVLKEELGLNMVRTSHYPQSRHFLDRCDEIGLLVFEEIPGWQHIGGEAWKEQVVRDVEDMIIRDRNHPSIVIWGVRINESQDDHELYARTNELARKLDPTRATGGVRYIVGSELLEDVYTMNDFVHDGGHQKYLVKEIRNFDTYDDTEGVDGETTGLREPSIVTKLDHPVPYLVTEYNGHMYPTKRFDQEERVMEHALRHTRVQNASYADEGIAGAIGWCAFDYNTHADFGSGDKICYHGVMDMFRLPKFAANVYRSQKRVEQEIILEPVTYWSRGERNIGGVVPLVVFTNCDEVEFIYGEERKGVYRPNQKKYPALPHPPVVIDELTGHWGMKWEDAVFIGYVDGQEVIRRRYSRNPVPTELRVAADDTALEAGDWDVTRVVVDALDEYGNVLPFYADPVSVEVEGAGDLIGPSTLSLIGGRIAFWVRTKGEAGNIRVKVSAPSRFDPREVSILVQ